MHVLRAHALIHTSAYVLEMCVSRRKSSSTHRCIPHTNRATMRSRLRWYFAKRWLFCLTRALLDVLASLCLPMCQNVYVHCVCMPLFVVYVLDLGSVLDGCHNHRLCVHASYLHGVVQILIKFQKNGFLPSNTDIKSLNQEWEATFTSEVSALRRHPHQPEPLLSLHPHPVTRKQGGQKSSFVKT